MVLRPAKVPLALLLSAFLSIPLTWADDGSTFDCHVKVDEIEFDLTSLAGEHTASQKRNTPPSSTIDLLRFNLCTELKKQENVADRDQCETGTRACLTQVNQKAEEKDRITAVIPLMNSLTHDLEFKAGESSTKYLSIISKGPEYPHPIDNIPTSQSLNITLLCRPGETLDPAFISYDGSRVNVEWGVSAGCPLKGDGGDKNNDGNKGGNDNGEAPQDETKNAGSGIGWFFLMLILAFAAYFGLGAYYNYSTYGARGADLIPHRDFWKDVPYMLSDVVRHLCSSVRPRRSSNRGYIAV